MIDLQAIANNPVNVHSQFGEDGVNLHLFSSVKPVTKTCIEVGANDGLSCSNTAALYKDGWQALLIERDKKLFMQLAQNTGPYKVRGFLESVGMVKGLDNIVEHCLKMFNEDFRNPDLISLDIDGNETFTIRESKICPMVWIIEFNPTLPFTGLYEQKRNDNMGCSLLSLEYLMAERGYKLVAVTDANGVFVRSPESESFREIYPDEWVKTPAGKFQSRACSSYSGDYILIPGRSDEPTWGRSGRIRSL